MESASATVLRNKRNTIPAKRKNRDKEQAPFSAAGNGRSDFLGQTFLPVIEDKALIKQQGRITAQFFRSLQYVADLYKFTPLPANEYPFPVNIAMALQHAQCTIQFTAPETTLDIEEEGSKLYIKAEGKVDCSGTVLFVPFKLIRDLLVKKQYRSAELLMSVYNYLRKVGMPCYRENDSYVFYQYDGILWVTQKERDEEGYIDYINELDNAFYWGDVINRKIKHPIHAERWKQRLDSYKPENTLDEQLFAIAKKAYYLFEAYPERCFADYVPAQEDIAEDDDDYYDERQVITPYHYLSFVWSTEGLLFESLINYMNADFSECLYVLSPYREQHFHRRQTAIKTGLAFEYGIYELIILLNELKIS